jgi:ketosteroid isomerase-like protein
MGADLERALAELVEARRLEEVLLGYFDRVDARDPVGASKFFTSDVEFQILTGKQLQGRERYARALGRVLDRYRATSHHLTNFRATIDGDRAESFAYVYAFHRMDDTGEPWHLWVRIRDRFVREDGRWLISYHALLGVDSQPHRPDIPQEWYTGHPGHPLSTPQP